MEEKKVAKISLSTFFLILAIIAIIVMGIFMYKFYNEKVEATKELEEQQMQLFTDEQVKTTLTNYLELQAVADCDSLLEKLTEKGNLNYNSANNTILDDGTVITNIKFSDYKSAMLNYVSESEFERNWSSTLDFSEDSNGLLTKVQGGGNLRIYTINSITKNDDSTYSAKISFIVDENDTEKEDEDITFTVKSYNDNCVIDSIN